MGREQDIREQLEGQVGSRYSRFLPPSCPTQSAVCSLTLLSRTLFLSPMGFCQPHCALKLVEHVIFEQCIEEAEQVATSPLP